MSLPMLPMGRPLLPKAEAVLPYLRQLDECRWYSNGGPVVALYEARLQRLFGCSVVATASGTAGLIAAATVLGLPRETWMPAWTFVATANAVVAAGCAPTFADVDEATWTPDVADVAVAPFGSPVAYEGLYLLDAAAAFDACAEGLMTPGATPAVISTHATKVFSTGEGGVVLSTDERLLAEIRDFINHGLTDIRDVPTPGTNGKLSGYQAAVGLAELDGWAEKRGRWLDLKRRYAKAFDAYKGTTPFDSEAWVSSSFCVRLKGRDGDSVREKLAEKGIASRAVWGKGCHRYGAFDSCPREPLPVTDRLAREAVFLPYSIDQTDEEIERIAGALADAVAETPPCA